MRCFSLRTSSWFISPAPTARCSSSQEASCISLRGQPHALGGIGDGAMPVEQAGILAARAVEIIRRLLHQAHAFAEDLVELLGRGEARQEIDGDGRGFGRRHGGGFLGLILAIERNGAPIMTMVPAVVNDVPRSAADFRRARLMPAASQKKPREVRGFEVFKQGGVKQSDLSHSEQSGQGLRFKKYR